MITVEKIHQYRQLGEEQIKLFSSLASFGTSSHPPLFTDSSFLFLRATEQDDGSRALPSDVIFWNSPDIELRDNDGFFVTTNEILSGRPYTVEVNVNNAGDGDAHVAFVELYICDPSIGFDRQHAKLVGIQNISILGQSTSKAIFQFLGQNDHIGHKCFFARIFSFANKEISENLDIFDVLNDRLVAQQNISIVSQESELSFILSKTQAENRFELVIEQVKKIPDSFRKLSAIQNLNFIKKPTANNLTLATTGNLKPHQIRLASTALKKRVPASPAINIKKTKKGLWQIETKTPINRLSLAIPDMGMKVNEYRCFAIWVKNKDSMVIGGLTLVVQGSASAQSDRLKSNGTLRINEAIASPNGLYTLIMQFDGNLVLYENKNRPLWATNTDGSGATIAVMQADGNLVLYDNAGRPIWASNTHGNANSVLVLQDDRNLVMYQGNRPIWSSNTLI